MRQEDRDRALKTVNQRVYEQIGQRGDSAIENTLSDAVYHEKRRLEHDHKSPAAALDRKFWRDIQTGLVSPPASELHHMLKRSIAHHSSEIIGQFSPRVYSMATQMIPPALTFLLNASTPRHIFRRIPRGLPTAQDNIHVQGYSSQLQRLHARGHIMLVPTHISHLDSIVIGWVLFALNLPPFIYGAGLNLFSNPMLRFFMHNLGAYKVDRKKKHSLYKDVLKEYCTTSLEMGYDNLFFPGGTRTRSGAVESHLKLGLAGCGLRAYQNNLRLKKERPELFIVPATLSYHLVLEAETLIDDFLQEVGKSRYVIDDDESTQPEKVYRFIRNLITLNARIFCTFGKPLDPFGNEVDENGVSRDHHGRPIDISRYVIENGEIRNDDQRDRELTAYLGERVVESFHSENVVLSTHLLARAVWDQLRESNPGVDTYRLLRVSPSHRRFSTATIQRRLEKLRHTVDALAAKEKIRVDPFIQRHDAAAVLKDALKHFSSYSYHTDKDKGAVIHQAGDSLEPQDLNLVLYYQNRLQGYDLSA